MKETIETFSPEDTYNLGVHIGESAKAGDVYTLNGDLGAGKTLFAGAFAKGLGIEEPVVSPTFTIMQIYEGGRLPLYHYDVYRIQDISEMDEIGFEEYAYGDGVCLIEWADYISELLPEKRTDIFIEYNYEKGPDYRRIRFENKG